MNYFEYDCKNCLSVPPKQCIYEQQEIIRICKEIEEEEEREELYRNEKDKEI